MKGERQSLRILGSGRDHGQRHEQVRLLEQDSTQPMSLCLYTDVFWFLHSSWLNTFFSIGPKIQFKREKKYSEGIDLMS